MIITGKNVDQRCGTTARAKNDEGVCSHGPIQQVRQEHVKFELASLERAVKIVALSLFVECQ